MKITRKKFGQHVNGRQCYLWILQAGEVTATFTDYGASWLSFLMPDSKGNSDDILLARELYSLRKNILILEPV